MLHDLLHVEIPVWEKVIRTVAVYGVLLVLLRLAGKRQLGQFNTFDLVVLLLLSNVVQNAIIGPDDSLLGGVIGAVVLIGANAGLVALGYRRPAILGRATRLVEGGRVDRSALRRELITEPELESALRREGIDGIAATETVVLEPDGALTPTRKPEPTLADVLARLDRIEARL
jgi:uncharacterized membrane protein YcaP (DUF421 family)